MQGECKKSRLHHSFSRLSGIKRYVIKNAQKRIKSTQYPITTELF